MTRFSLRQSGMGMMYILRSVVLKEKDVPEVGRETHSNINYLRGKDAVGGLAGDM